MQAERIEATAELVAELVERAWPADRHDAWPARVVLGLENVEVLAVTEWGRPSSSGRSCRVDLWAPDVDRRPTGRTCMERVWPTWAATGWRRNDRGYLDPEGAPAVLYGLAVRAAGCVGLDPWGDDHRTDSRPVWRVLQHLPMMRVTVR